MGETKCNEQTQCIQNKLKQKQEKQRKKFQCIVNDQLQILQLTQELNEDNTESTNITTTTIPHDEYFLYKQEIDQLYLQKIKQFEQKQKNELNAFRNDLEQLKQLKLDIKKKNILNLNVDPNTNQNHNISPPRRHRKNIKNIKNIKKPIHNQPIDLLTGQHIVEHNEIDHGRPPPTHSHSASLPLIENVITPPLQQKNSKFKVSQHHNIKHQHTPSDPINMNNINMTQYQTINRHKTRK